ncbi:DNA polymerase epsilon subunit 4 isoform X2 [Contarinia nasturtii]|uniref:DNA polymerase epsilon subunit 4 isoform X2 n=1 Tax=Contarinia nasturtii TaxID=265458 RepID=UPI0012D44C66|nr:DNA polymerase epsilon subunit 4 isoform X2 [Contarinia nasturtii]
METNNEIVPETPDMEFSEDVAMEQETPDIHFDELHAEDETPDINFSEIFTDKNQERFIAEESDIDDLDEPDQYVDEDDEIAENNQETGDINHSELTAGEKTKEGGSKSKDTSDRRLVHLPSARIKHIMKVDPDVSLITGECTFLVTKATELFIESLAKEAFTHTSQAKKKTVQKRDVDAAIENVESLMFLEGMMNF